MLTLDNVFSKKIKPLFLYQAFGVTACVGGASEIRKGVRSKFGQ